MSDVPRISVEEARRKAMAGEALLVCAYADEAKCATMKLEGAISLPALEARQATLPKDRELIFYCA
jgi:rhodanese-related sulfurtransferase